MSGHTPGPWRISRHASTHVVGADDRGICSAGGYTRNTIDADVLLAENEANARLIALAPEMYEALASMVTACELRQGQPIPEDEFPQYHAAVALLRRAQEGAQP